MRFKELLKEVKMTSSHSTKFLDLIKKGLHASDYEIENTEDKNGYGILKVTFDDKYDTVLIFNARSELIAYELNDKYFEVPSSVHSMNDLFKNIKLFSKTGRPIKNLKTATPVQVQNDPNKKYRTEKEGKYLRIYALKSFNDVKEGDKGGLIESEKNLSHKGNCWIYDNAKVYENAKVYDEAKVNNTVDISDDAAVYGNAKIVGNAILAGDVNVLDNAIVDYDVSSGIITE